MLSCLCSTGNHCDVFQKVYKVFVETGLSVQSERLLQVCGPLLSATFLSGVCQGLEPACLCRRGEVGGGILGSRVHVAVSHLVLPHWRLTSRLMRSLPLITLRAM